MWYIGLIVVMSAFCKVKGEEKLPWKEKRRSSDRPCFKTVS